MAHLLQRSQFSQEDRVPDVEVRLAGVEPKLEAQLLARSQRQREGTLGDDLNHSSRQNGIDA
jgi:hypothetical protein